MGVVFLRAGSYRGKWIRYQPRKRRSRDTRAGEVTCVRCRAVTTAPAGVGWSYRRGGTGWGQRSAQLCPVCLTAVRRPEPDGPGASPTVARPASGRVP